MYKGNSLQFCAKHYIFFGCKTEKVSASVLVAIASSVCRACTNICRNESHVVDNKSNLILSLFPFRKYVPEVKDLPLEYVFEPWTAPEAVQDAAGCVVGRNYPLPLADHKEQQKVCMQRLKELVQNLGTGIRGTLTALKT